MREEPIHTDYPFDTLNIPFWDTWRKEYVGYFRGVAGQGSSDFFTGVRWIRRGTSKDFLDWSALENIDCGDTPGSTSTRTRASNTSARPGRT